MFSQSLLAASIGSLSLFLLVLMPVRLSAAESAADAEQRIDADGVSGTLVIVGGGGIPDQAKTFFASRIPDAGSVVVIGAASEDPVKAAKDSSGWLTESGVRHVVVTHTSSDPVADLGALADAIQQAAGVWICGGQQSRLAAAYKNTEVEAALQQLLKRGGIIGGTSAGAAIMSGVMIASGKAEPQLSGGLGLLPGVIIDQHFTERSRLARSRLAVAAHPDQFGLGIDEGTAVIVSGRRMQILGKGAATFLLAGSSFRESEERRIEAGQVADLVQWRRAALSRASGINPGLPQFGVPQVKQGSLVIVGGGGMPQSIVDRFVELAGGKNAHIVVLPTAVPRDVARRQRVPGFLANCGAASVTMLPQMLPDEIAADDFQQAVKQATAVWFGGGRQWNFVDAYDGTNAVQLFKDVLQRGGVIGGSSAGATIQGEFLVRGHPLGNMVMMAEGYERGFAFLPGTAIDQHFAQRGRKPDLIPVIRRHPQLLGIGIDEATALVVQGTTAEVVGNHAVHFLTARRIAAQSDSQSDASEAVDLESMYQTFSSGESVDLGQFLGPQN